MIRAARDEPRASTRRSLLASSSAAGAIALAGGARATRAAPAAAAGLDAEVIDGPLGARLHDYLARASAFGAWGTALVAIDDKPVLHRGYGWADVAGRRPNTIRTLYDVGSTTKTMTAGGILLLESEGRLSLDDPIGRFFPQAPPDKQGIRIRHLATHTSGIIDPPQGDYDPIGREELIAIVFASALGGAPGAVYNYSNAGFSLLAAIIETVTGAPYETFMRERLFLPAGMTTMGYTLPSWDPGRVAHTYNHPVDHGTPLERLRSAKGPGWILLGNGGLIGTAADLYRWERFFRSGSVIPPAEVAMATRPQFQRSARRAVGFDWEIEIAESGERAWGHGSDAPPLGLNGWIGYRPAQKASVAWLANNRLNGASSRHFVVPSIERIVRGKAVTLPPEPRTVTSADLRKAEGRFVGEGGAIGVRASHGYLEVGANGHEAVDLFNARQGEAAVSEARSLSERAALFMRALDRRDAAALAGFSEGPPEAAALLAQWREVLAAHRGLRSGTVLGTFRLDRNAYVTTIRFDFADGPVVARFSWQDGKPAPSTEDLFLPTLAGPMTISPVAYAAWQPFWRPQDGALFTFDLLTGTRLELKTVERGGRVAALSAERGGVTRTWVRQASPSG
jgi:CubicO group peptidase (beta-lactamase class C family)